MPPEVIVGIMLITMGPVVMVSWVFAMVLHEFAHLAAAKLIDRDGTYLVDIGIGRQIASFSMWDSQIRLRVAPIQGQTSAISNGRTGSLWEQVLAVAAGPLVNAVLAVASFLLIHFYMVENAGAFSFAHFISAPRMFWGGPRDYLLTLPLSGRILYTFGGVNALAMWLSIIPFKLGSYMSDGWFVVQLVRIHMTNKKKQAQAKVEG